MSVKVPPPKKNTVHVSDMEKRSCSRNYMIKWSNKNIIRWILKKDIFTIYIYMFVACVHKWFPRFQVGGNTAKKTVSPFQIYNQLKCFFFFFSYVFSPKNWTISSFQLIQPPWPFLSPNVGFFIPVQPLKGVTFSRFHPLKRSPKTQILPPFPTFLNLSIFFRQKRVPIFWL